ncbi:membrane AbrB-like protein [Pseudorhizobium tarimense]|uniref:Membrane AbrB-like protein n=1 Tax=Pseudorhizobium tarimense TaxID=1079109 RepID=A0ABV2HAT8_9HYPH|nr:AbrB family transcriptional regulator [Pseudorhizobium tarimense]MCJ8520799.1 AbrB family transcriptional regulator [Pseudorhizobium tarimense]
MSLPEFRTFLLTVAIAAAGAAMAYLLAFPAPFLVGPAVAVTFGGLAGLQLRIPVIVRNASFVVVGLSMGTGLTPEVFVAAQTWPLSFAMVPVAVVLLLWVATWVLQRFFGYDRTTAVLAASPGHLSFVMSLAAETRSDLLAVGIIQSVRVLALTLTVPLIVEVLGLQDAGPHAALPPLGLSPLVCSFGVAVLLGLLFQRWRVPAALLLGGLVASGSTHLTGIVDGQMPVWIMTPTYILLGGMIGSRFSGASLKAMRVAFVAGGVVTVVVVVLAALIAALVSSVTAVPVDAALIAFAPGGLETMAAMAVMLNAQPTYVGAHHVLRLLILSGLMPYALRKDMRISQR